MPVAFDKANLPLFCRQRSVQEAWVRIVRAGKCNSTCTYNLSREASELWHVVY